LKGVTPVVEEKNVVEEDKHSQRVNNSEDYCTVPEEYHAC
jgi:hypothetical protein